MKRSEIIKLIEENIVMYEYDDSLHCDADALIILLQNSGMLPPAIQKPLKYHNGKQLEVEYVNEWESEDE